MKESIKKPSLSLSSSFILRAVRELCLLAICSLIILISSRCRIPFYPVPFTLQTLAVVIVSIFAGKKRALLSLSIFVAFWNPFVITGGYIAGFFLMPLIIGNDALKLTSRKLLVRILCAHLAVLLIGTAVLACFIGLKAAFVSGFLFFIPSGILKGIFSFSLARSFGKLAQ